MRYAIGLVYLLWVPLTAEAQQGFVTTKEPYYDGRRITIDLPPSQHHRNVGGRDSAGLCVSTSIWHAALWQSVSDIYGFRDWLRNYPGGSYPEKLDATLKNYCKQKGIPLPLYFQHEGGDVSVLELALKTGRMPCITYCGVDNFYGNKVIGHMVSLVFLDEKYGCILDNNEPGAFRWMPRAELIARWRGIKTNGQPYYSRRYKIGGGWAVILLDPPPSPYKSIPKVTELTQKWGPLGCGPVGPSVNGIGNPPSNDHIWGQFPDGKWGWLLKPKTEPKVEPKNEVEVAPKAEFPPDGVISDKLSNEPSFSISGKKCSKHQGMQALIGSVDANLTDDSKRFNLSVVGDAAFQRMVKDHLTRVPADLLDKLHVKFYLPTDWQVSQFALPQGLALREPAVNRFGRQVGAVSVSNYTLEQLLNLLKLINDILNPKPPVAPLPTPVPVPNPNPNVQPTPTPDQPAPAPAPTPDIDWRLLLSIGVILLFLFLNRKKEEVK